MLAQEGVSADAHGSKIERAGHVPRTVLQQWIGPGRAQQAVAVAPGDGRVTGVEALRRDPGLENRDGRSELAAQRPPEPLQQRPGPGLAFRPFPDDRLVQIRVHDLRRGVHAGVGPTGAGQRHLVAGHRAQGGGQQARHGPLATLRRETVEGRPVIGDKEHYATKRPRRGRFALGLEEPHTSSTRAIGALSP